MPVKTSRKPTPVKRPVKRSVSVSARRVFQLFDVRAGARRRAAFAFFLFGPDFGFDVTRVAPAFEDSVSDSSYAS